MTLGLCAPALALSAMAQGSVPTQWTIRLIARDGNAAQSVLIPAGTGFTQSGVYNDPSIDADGSVSIRFNTPANTTQAIEGFVRFNAPTNAGSIWTAPPTPNNALIYSSNLSMRAGKLAVPTSGLINSIEVLKSDNTVDRSLGLGGSQPVYGQIAGLKLMPDGSVSYRCSAGNGSGGTTLKFLVESIDNAGVRTQTPVADCSNLSNPYYLLGVPAGNDNAQLAAKVSLRAGGYGIMRFGPGQSPATVFQSSDLAGSDTIGDLVALSNNNQLAYFVRRGDLSPVAWQLRKTSGGAGTLVATGASSGSRFDISGFNITAPQINSAGLVVFKANQLSGGTVGPGLFVSDGTSTVRVAGEGTPITLPNGTTMTLGFGVTPNRYAIMGNFAMNDAGKIAFIGRLSDGTSALLLATPNVVRCGRADVAGLGGSGGPDGQLTTDDLIVFLGAFFGGNTAVADLAGLGGGSTPDGQLTADDLIAFLNAFFAPCP
jgi:hypothetical protein